MRRTLLTLIVITVLSTGGILWNLTSQAWASKIVFVRIGGDWLNTEICTVRPDGKQLRNLTETPGIAEYLPVWSPDRTKIAFKRWKEKWILVMDSDGRNVRAMEGVDADFPSDGYAWSPDGRKIVSAVAWYFSLYDVETEKEETVIVPDAGFIGNFAWSPDGQRLAFEFWKPRGIPETTDICVINVDGSGFSELTRHPGNDRYPAWSPDGQQIAFYSDRNRRGGIFLMNADGSDVRRLTTGGEERPSWSPDGQKIAFHIEQKDSIFIGVMKKNGRNIKLIAEGYDPSWQSTFPGPLSVKPAEKVTTTWGQLKLTDD